MNPDLYTFIPVLDACASLGACEEGKRLHAQIIAKGYESDIFVAMSLLHMYAKCGSIKDAQRVILMSEGIGTYLGNARKRVATRLCHVFGCR